MSTDFIMSTTDKSEDASTPPPPSLNRLEIIYGPCWQPLLVWKKNRCLCSSLKKSCNITNMKNSPKMSRALINGLLSHHREKLTFTMRRETRDWLVQSFEGVLLPPPPPYVCCWLGLPFHCLEIQIVYKHGWRSKNRVVLSFGHRFPCLSPACRSPN